MTFRRFILGLVVFVVYCSAVLVAISFLIIEKNDSQNIAMEQSSLHSTTKAVLNNDVLLQKIENDSKEDLDSIVSSGNHTIDFKNHKEEVLTTSSYELNDVRDISTIENKPKEFVATYFGVYDQLGNKLSPCKEFSIIYKNQSKVKIPYPCRDYGLQIKALLDSNTELSVLIKSYYDIEETEEIGDSRAQYFKVLLHDIVRIPNERMLTGAIKRTIHFTKQGFSKGGVEFIIGSSNQLNELLLTLEEPTANHDTSYILKRAFNSSYEGDVFHINSELLDHLKQIKTYLSNYPDKNITVQSFLKNYNGKGDMKTQLHKNADLVKTTMLVLGIGKDRIKILTNENSLERDINNNCIVIRIE